MEPALRIARIALQGAGAMLTALLVLHPSPATAQRPGRPYRIGVVNEAWAANHPTVEGLKAGLKARGLLEGRDVTFDIRFTEGDPDKTPRAAADLVAAGVDLLFTSNEAATRAAKEATLEIPIVFTLVGDPVAAGIVERLARPGRNITGVSSLTTELAPKRLEVLKTLVPTVRRVWAIYYAADPSSLAAVRKAHEVAGRLGLEIVSRPVLTSGELDRVLREIKPGDALLPPDIATLDIPASILEVSISSRIPAVFPTELWVGYGALVSYGSGYHAQGVQAARLVAKILAGDRPRDLPVEGADRIGLAINLRTADLLGVVVPRKLLLRADTVRR